jgi:hypothetical protein
MLGSANDPGALKAVTRALAMKARNDGFQGFVDIVDIIVDALSLESRQSARFRANARLESVRRSQRSSTTEILVRAAKSSLVNPESFLLADGSPMPTSELRIIVAANLLADLADGLMCPAAMLPELVEEGIVSFQDLHARRDRAKAHVASSTQTRRLAAQLLSDPSGGAVIVPRMQREKLTQAEILLTALTD